MAKENSVFITVGTTKFEKLIETVTSEEVLNVLNKLGYKTITLQTGNSNYTERSHPVINLHYHKYFPNIDEQIHNASLIISHAGAGTCLEVLKKQKPLIVVINEDLMDNHQIELADELQKWGYLYYCTCDTLASVLSKAVLSNLKKYPECDSSVFGQYVDKSMGYV